MTTLVIFAGRMGSFLHSSVMTIGGQLRLAGLALLTLEERVAMKMKPLAVNSDFEANNIHSLLVQHEIKEAASHIQSMLK